MSADNYWTVIPTGDGRWQPRMGFDSNEGWPEYREDGDHFAELGDAIYAGYARYDDHFPATEYGYYEHPAVARFRRNEGSR